MTRATSVIALLCDALPTNRLGPYAGDAPTPNLDRLAAEAIVFDACRASTTGADYEAAPDHWLEADAADERVVRIDGDDFAPAIAQLTGAGLLRVHHPGLDLMSIENATDDDLAEAVAEFDASLGEFLAAIDEADRDAVLIVGALAAAEPPGLVPESLRAHEHPLPPEALCLPLLIRLPARSGWRTSTPAQPCDLPETAAELLGTAAHESLPAGLSLLPLLSGARDGSRQLLWSRSETHAALCSDECCVVTDTETIDEASDADAAFDLIRQTQLYLKPEDHWELTDRATDDPRVVAAYLLRMHVLTKAERSGEIEQMRELLTEPIDAAE